MAKSECALLRKPFFLITAVKRDFLFEKGGVCMFEFHSWNSEYMSSLVNTPQIPEYSKYQTQGSGYGARFSMNFASFASIPRTNINKKSPHISRYPDYCHYGP